MQDQGGRSVGSRGEPPSGLRNAHSSVWTHRAERTQPQRALLKARTPSPRLRLRLLPPKGRPPTPITLQGGASTYECGGGKAFSPQQPGREGSNDCMNE